MSTYNGRPGPNVSQFLHELKTASTQDTSAEESFDDFAMFTNTQFFDYDSGQNTDFQPQPAKIDIDTSVSASPDDLTNPGPTLGELPALDFMQDFNFGDFSAYPTPTVPNFTDGLTAVPPVHQTTTNVFPQAAPQQQNTYIPPAPRSSDKRKGTDHNPNRQVSFEEASRMAAEEDKRRRNTAASARFRIKKKQREQALEKSAKEMTEKVTVLEGRIQQLETENKWLKNLIMEKNEGNDDIATLWKEFSTKQLSEKSKEQGKSGVKDSSEKGVSVKREG